MAEQALRHRQCGDRVGGDPASVERVVASDQVAGEIVSCEIVNLEHIPGPDGVWAAGAGSRGQQRGGYRPSTSVASVWSAFSMASALSSFVQ